MVILKETKSKGWETKLSLNSQPSWVSDNAHDVKRPNVFFPRMWENEKRPENRKRVLE